MPLRDEVRLRHVIDACAKIEEFVGVLPREDFEADEMRVFAVIRLIEIIGEAANHLADETKQRRPEIPWRQIIGARNRLIHGYFDVDLAIVWEIAARDAPRIRVQAHELLDELQQLDVPPE